LGYEGEDEGQAGKLVGQFSSFTLLLETLFRQFCNSDNFHSFISANPFFARKTGLEEDFPDAP
jgi:hypothetical protein